MRLSIWSYDANPAVDPRLLKLSISRCELDVIAGLLVWVDPKDKTKGCLTSPPAGYRPAGDEEPDDGPIGVGNLLPFSRVQKQIDGLHLAPDKIRYPIPALGARNRPMWVSDVNAAS